MKQELVINYGWDRQAYGTDGAELSLQSNNDPFIPTRITLARLTYTWQATTQLQTDLAQSGGRRLPVNDQLDFRRVENG